MASIGERVMISDYDIYCTFRQAQGLHNNRPYRLPKDWESTKAKMSEVNRNTLDKAVIYFNTTWSNIDILTYMKCGFELYKGFSYHQFLRTDILQHYISKDKSKKRRMETLNSEIDNTFDNIVEYMLNKVVHTGYTTLQSFCKFRSGEIRDIILMYNKNMVDQMTLCYCIQKKYIVLSDDERPLVPYITQRYRDICDLLVDMKGYITTKEKEIDETD